MEDLIYNFLLQSKFPRASILLDPDLIENVASNATAVEDAPAFVIVDPETAQPLAIINAVDAVNDETLRAVAIKTRNYAAKLAGKTIQGFVIRIDFQAVTENEQVQFYRIWPNKSLQRLTPKKFPDLATLKVARKLADVKNIEASSTKPEATDSYEESLLTRHENKLLPAPSLSLYFPAIMLLALVLLDSIITAVRGSPLLTLTQSVLVVVAALLFTVPPAIRYLRQS